MDRAPVTRTTLADVVRGRRWTWLAATVAVLTLALPGAAAARVPQGFAGVVIDGPMWPPIRGVDLAHQFDVMVANGVENVRWEIDWGNIEPYQSWSDVPAAQRADFTDVDGLPLDLRDLDNFVGLAAKHGLTMHPAVLDAPYWDAAAVGNSARTPQDYGPYGTFLTALIDRYGPHGSFWRTRGIPLDPIRTWQVWNEPDLIGYWDVQPNFEPSYVAMLKVAHDAIKRADPGAQVILGGLTNASWEELQAIYAVPGARYLFDVVGVLPYTHLPSGLLTILGFVRQVMNNAGDGDKPIAVDEFGWNSSVGESPNHFGIEVTPAGQATNTGQAIRLLTGARTRLRLYDIDYNDWAGVETPDTGEFNFAGLFRVVGSRFVAKPVLAVFRRDVLGIESCRQKASTATRCAHPG